MTKRAFIVVDTQLDFCEGGALAVEGGNEVARRIREHLTDFAHVYDQVIFSQDWHNPLDFDASGNCGHFAIPPAEPDFANTWPVHCVRGTDGALFHGDIREALLNFPAELPDPIVVRKGQGVPAYSAFEGSIPHQYSFGGARLLNRFAGATLGSVLKGLNIDLLAVAGLAFDYCVKETALDARAADIDVKIFKDVTASVSPINDEANISTLEHYGVEVIS